MGETAGAGAAGATLVVLRGNSASGKSTIAQEMRSRLGRGVAWVEQDYIRRILLRERDLPGGVNIGLISQTVRYALDHGYDVVLEGILDASRYAPMLRELVTGHRGPALHYYVDVSFAETLRRHAGRPRQAAEFGEAELRRWYQPRDFLPHVTETILGEGETLDDIVRRIVSDMHAARAGRTTDLSGH